VPGPFGATLLIGYSTRSGEYTRSRYLATLAQRKPRVTGWTGSPWILVAFPSSTVMSTPQASGQSCGQAAWTICFTSYRLYGHSPGRRRVEKTNKMGRRKAAPRKFSVLNYGNTRTRPATTMGFWVLRSLNTSPRVTRLAAPADCKPASPLIFSNMVGSPV